MGKCLRKTWNVILLRQHHILGLSGFLLLFEAVAYWLFKYHLKASDDITAACMTGIGVIGGYFIAHYLEIICKQEERKYARYSEFLKGLRFLALEENLWQTDQQKNLRDSFQYATYESALLIASVVYDKKFKPMLKAFEELMTKKSDPDAKAAFQSKQKDFVNALRRDFNFLSEIEFETWDFRLK